MGPLRPGYERYLSNPEDQKDPKYPIPVDTIGHPMAIASNTFSRVPPPTRKGMT